jgi:type VI secretion system protein ImpH
MAGDHRNSAGLLGAHEERAAASEASISVHGAGATRRTRTRGAGTDLAELVADFPGADREDERLGELISVAHRSAFFPLMSVLERMTKDAVRVGGDGPPSEEAIRFRHDPRLVFASGDIQSAAIRRVPVDPEQPHGKTRPVIELITTFLGLTGALSPLPLYVAEEVNAEDEESSVRRDFLDVFHHRLVSILFRAVSRYSPVREHLSEGTDDVWVRRVLSVAGMDPETYLPATTIPVGKLLRLAPLVAHRGRGARALHTALDLVVGEHIAPEGRIEIQEFAGDWVRIHPGQRTALGTANNLLGRGAMLGEKAYDRGGRFRVCIGPLDGDGRDAFSERGPGLRLVRDCVNLMVRESLDYDIELRFSASAVRPFRLSARASSRLGTNTRLSSRQDEEVITLRNMRRFQFPGDRPAPEA